MILTIMEELNVTSHDKCCDENFSCQANKLLSIISSKWTLLILRELLDGTKRFGQLKKSLPGISPKTLSQRLQELEKEGLVDRKIYPEVPPRVEYSLTQKAESLKSIFFALAEWNSEHSGDKA